jgi:hypothetical protein
MKRLFASTIFAVALALLLALGAHAAVAQEIHINSVDNYAGNSNVYTDKADTSVVITEVDENGKSVESWTGTTDGKGKITIPAGHNLSKAYLRIKISSRSLAQIEGIVLPDSVHDRQPFSFAAPQVVEGEVVTIKTVEGEVVARHSTDKYGRVFLAAGLPAGAYLIARGNGSETQSLGRVQVIQAYIDPWAWMGTDGWVPIPIDPICVPPPALKLNDAFTLSGRGFSPNFADMQVSLSGAGQTQTLPVLAATADELTLGPIRDLKPGAAELTLKNTASGRSAEPQQVMLYDVQAHLERNKLHGGEQTLFVVNTLPEELPMKIHAIISGQATFSGGHSKVDAVTQHGRADIPVAAKRGSGNFHITYEGRPMEQMSLARALPAPTSAAKTSKASCSCGCGGSAQPRCAFKNCGCSK